MAVKITETQQERITRRNTLIRKEFEKMSSKEFKGVRQYSTNYILTKIADQYFLSPATIEDIVFHRK